MKKLIFITIVLTFLLGACTAQTYIGTVTYKRHVPSYTELIPAGYRYDCGISVTNGAKHECGFNFYLADSKFHADEYYVVIKVNDRNVEIRVHYDFYTSVEIGDKVNVAGLRVTREIQ